MLVNFDAAVRALAEAIVRERCPGSGSGGALDGAPVAGFLLAVHARMPDYLRFPFRCLTLAFDLWALPSAGRPFHRLPHALRWRQIEAWRGSKLGFRRDLIKFYETLAVYAWYAELYGADYVHALAA